LEDELLVGQVIHLVKLKRLLGVPPAESLRKVKASGGGESSAVGTLGVMSNRREPWWSPRFHSVLRLLGLIGDLEEDCIVAAAADQQAVILESSTASEVSTTVVPQEVGIVRIVGVKCIGGVGKTTLAKKLYDEPDVRD
jgi:hypothetical protein